MQVIIDYCDNQVSNTLVLALTFIEDKAKELLNCNQHHDLMCIFKNKHLDAVYSSSE